MAELIMSIILRELFPFRRKRSGAQISTHGAQRVFFQSGYLGLGDADGIRYLHLGFARSEERRVGKECRL